jgi:phage/plasmid-associated DNA primase
MASYINSDDDYRRKTPSPIEYIMGAIRVPGATAGIPHDLTSPRGRFSNIETSDTGLTTLQENNYQISWQDSLRSITGLSQPEPPPPEPPQRQVSINWEKSVNEIYEQYRVQFITKIREDPHWNKVQPYIDVQLRNWFLEPRYRIPDPNLVQILEQFRKDASPILAETYVNELDYKDNEFCIQGKIKDKIMTELMRLRPWKHFADAVDQLVTEKIAQCSVQNAKTGTSERLEVPPIGNISPKVTLNINSPNITVRTDSRPQTPLMPSDDPNIINAQYQELGEALLTLRHHEVSEKLTPLCKDWRLTKESLYGYDERSRLWIVREESDLGLWINELIKSMITATRTSIHTQRQRQIRDGVDLPQEEKDRQEKAYKLDLKRISHSEDKIGNVSWTNNVTSATIPRLRRLSEIDDFENKLDANINMLALLDGEILNLQTLAIRDRVKSDYCTMVAGVSYDPNAEYKEWEDLVNKFQCYDPPTIEYFGECVAYSFTGSTHLQIYMFVIGKPNGGKTSIFDVLLRVAGDYGFNVPEDVYLKEKGSHNKEGPSPNMMKTEHKRFGVTAELAPDDEFSSKKLNTISSGERYTGRGLYSKKPKTFPFTMKAWFHSNYIPKLRLDAATIKRFRYFKATGQFMDNPDPDKKTTEFQKIAGYEHQFRDPKKLSGVLNWILVALNRFNKRGRTLPPVPASMVEALQAEVSDQDYISQWLEFSIDIFEEYKDSDYTLISDLYGNFCNWFTTNHRNISNPIKSSNKLGNELKPKYPDRWRHTKRGNVYNGFKIRSVPMTDLLRSGMANI